METETISLTKKAKRLINENSVVWLSEQLGLTRNTIYSRLKTDNWKQLEKEKLLKL